MVEVWSDVGHKQMFIFLVWFGTRNKTF